MIGGFAGRARCATRLVPGPRVARPRGRRRADRHAAERAGRRPGVLRRQLAGLHRRRRRAGPRAAGARLGGRLFAATRAATGVPAPGGLRRPGGAVLLGLATMLLPIDRVIAFNDFLDSERTVDDARSLGGSLSLTAELLAYVGQFMLAGRDAAGLAERDASRSADALPRHPRGDQRRPLRVPAADAAARRAGVLAHRARADAARRRPHPAATGLADRERGAWPPRRPPPAAARPRSGARGSGPNRSPRPARVPRRPHPTSKKRKRKRRD